MHSLAGKNRAGAVLVINDLINGATGALLTGAIGTRLFRPFGRIDLCVVRDVSQRDRGGIVGSDNRPLGMGETGNQQR